MCGVKYKYQSNSLSLQLNVEDQLDSVDTGAFIEFLKTEYEFNSQKKPHDNMKLIPYVEDRSLLLRTDQQTRDKRKVIVAAVDRYMSLSTCIRITLAIRKLTFTYFLIYIQVQRLAETHK